MDNSFGNRIKELRNLRGLTQESLAEQCNVSTTSLSRWELGQRLPNLKNQRKLAEILNVSIDDFYIELSRSLPQNVVLNEILLECQKLDHDEQQFILQIIQGLNKLNKLTD